MLKNNYTLLYHVVEIKTTSLNDGRIFTPKVVFRDIFKHNEMKTGSLKAEHRALIDKELEANSEDMTNFSKNDQKDQSKQNRY